MKNWLKLSLVIIFFASISLTIYFILRAFGLTSIENIRNILLKSKNWAMFVFILIELILFIFFCFVPVIETGMITMGIVLFGAWQGFILSSIACVLSSCILFVIGDKFGEGLARKLIGQKELEKAQDIVTHKSKFLLPIFFFIPGFPDDAICLVAGMTKMKFSYFFVVTFVCHIIDVALICFIGEFINWSTLTPIDWVLMINVLLIDFYLIYKFQHYLEKIDINKNKDKEEK